MLSSLLPWMALGGLLLMALHLTLCFRAQLPRKDSTEWILLYEKPAFSLYGEERELTKKDAAFAALSFVVQVAAFALFLFAPLLLAGKDIAAEVNWPSAVPIFLSAGGSGALLYVLCKLLTHNRSAAILSTLLLAGDIFRDPIASLFLLCMLLSLYLWFSRKEGLLGLELLLISACAMAFCVFTLPQASLLIAVFLLTVIFDGVWRCRKSEAPLWQLPVQLLAAALMFLLLLATLCATLFLPHFADAVKSGAFFETILLYLQGWRYVILPGAGTLLALTVQLPSVIYALGALVFLLWAVIAKRDAAALFLLGWNVAILLLALFTATSFYVLPAALSCGYIAARCFKRDYLATGISGIAVTTAVTFAITVAIYF